MRAAMRNAHTPRGQGASPRASPRAAAGARDVRPGLGVGAATRHGANMLHRSFATRVDAPAASQVGEVVRLTCALPAEAQDQVVAWQIAFE